MRLILACLHPSGMGSALGLPSLISYSLQSSDLVCLATSASLEELSMATEICARNLGLSMAAPAPIAFANHAGGELARVRSRVASQAPVASMRSAQRQCDVTLA
ncbi:hypothetical protein BGZ61DRAFT_458670 [Ilyonectria robusta]|uniref:uncharacterized protein n=1 Tax=Ilyonectria robusta TaxID=1079257 RepID=UPI001E8D57FE|nr:uncharacterized protein BGZ61DRAFT_458670 [Ilyonectria robusta]KAH8673014.1 hypothetical protein BGZ61DRAFT_458670 [Ilyonectria robusta]